MDAPAVAQLKNHTANRNLDPTRPPCLLDSKISIDSQSIDPELQGWTLRSTVLFAVSVPDADLSRLHANIVSYTDASYKGIDAILPKSHP